MRTIPDTIAVTTAAVHTDVAGEKAEVVLTADTDHIHVIDEIICSYDLAGIGNLKVIAGSTTILDVDIPGAGPNQFSFSNRGGLHNNTKNETVTITVLGVASNVPTLNVYYR
jgi:hypothetical protein